MRQHIKTLQEKYKNLKRWEQITLFLLVVAVIALIITNSQRQKSPFLNIDDDVEKEVILRSVSDLSLDTEPLNLIGIVQSESQVDIRTESAGSITRVLVKSGDQVKAGQIIAEIENSSQRAAVTQARSLVQAQQAQLDNLEDSFTSSGNTVAVENAYRTLLSSGLVAEPSSEDSVLTPPLISGVYTGSTEGIYDIRIVRGQQPTDYEFYLKGIEKIRTTAIIDNQLKSTALGNYGLKITFPESIETYIGSSWIIRIPNTEATSYVANLNAYNAARDNQLGTTDQISAQRAQVQNAKSNLDITLAQLEKTIIRSPISGTVNNLKIDLGDFVSVFQSVAEVANANQLEIKTYITENDKKSLRVGLPTMVAGKYKGLITSIDPAVDATTKKIEVAVSIEDESNLINGQSVNVSITRDNVSVNELDQIFIPLSALKVMAEGVVVFSVNQSNIVEKHIVKEGPLVGNKVLIVDGLTPDMRIITDVRGINVGDIVTIKE